MQATITRVVIVYYHGHKVFEGPEALKRYHELAAAQLHNTTVKYS